MTREQVTWEWWGHGRHCVAYNTSREFYEAVRAYYSRRDVQATADIIIGEVYATREVPA